MPKSTVPEKIREALEVRGIVRKPKMPAIEKLLEIAQVRRMGVMMVFQEYPREAEFRQNHVVTITLGEESWRAEDPEIDIALALAIADALEATEPVQGSLL